ncbi:MAG: hypothetical protein RSB99_02275 [Bacilli bacterium]
MFISFRKQLTRTTVRLYNINIRKKENKMQEKLKVKWVILIYVVLVAVAYTATLRIEKLESLEDTKILNQTISCNIR